MDFIRQSAAIVYDRWYNPVEVQPMFIGISIRYSRHLIDAFVEGLVIPIRGGLSTTATPGLQDQTLSIQPMLWRHWTG